jgi:hypothetical protein
MSGAAKKERASMRPFPQVGEHVVIGHGMWSEPDNWWIAPCEWSDGASFLVRDVQGWHPSHQPYLGTADAVMAVGTREQCEAICSAARQVRFTHAEAFRQASIALLEIK